MMSSGWLGWLVGLAAMMGLASQAGAAGQPILMECPGCSDPELRSILSAMGDGDRYVIDLGGRSMRKFVVSGTPTPPNPLGGRIGGGDDETSGRSDPQDLGAISVVQVRVDPWAWDLYLDLQALYDVNPAYFQNVEVTVEMGNYHLGINPNTGNAFSPFDIWFYGPTNQEWNTFTERLEDILAIRNWARDVVGEVIATAFFSIMQRFNSSGLQLGPIGGNLGWNQAGPWIVNFCNAGYCLKVRIRADGTFEFLNATDEAGNQVPQMYGSGWNGGYAIPGADPAFERLRDHLERRGIPVSGNSCSGWLMLICTYVNGVLNSCHTQISCD
jgi:hypothetical protein